MEKILLFSVGAIFSIASGLLTWMSWKDSRAAFSLIAKLDGKITSLEKEVESLKEKNGDKILKS